MMNNKGFMMAEVVVVSAIVLVTLVAMYTSYNKIFTLYNQRLNYYDVTTLYELAYIRDNDSVLLNYREVNVIDENTIIYYGSTEDIENPKGEIEAEEYNKLSVTFKEYLNYLSGSLDVDSLNIDGDYDVDLLVMEKCEDDKTNCKYAYLERLGLR